MNWSDLLGIISAVATIIVPFIIWAIWSLRNMVKEQVVPKVVNDDTSVATYAHQSREAALRAAEEAVAAKNAAVEAKDAAISAKTAAIETHQLVVDFLRGKQ